MLMKNAGDIMEVSFGAGDFIYAKYSQDGYYYFARIESIADQMALVKYFDDISEYLPVEDLKTFSYCVRNLNVQGNWESNNYYYPCEIINVKIPENRIVVRYTQDGIEEDLAPAMLRFEDFR